MHHESLNTGILRQLLQDATLRGISQKGRERLEWLVHFCENGKSVSDTSKHFGIPRMTLYRLLERFNSEDLTTLEDRSRRPHTVRKSSLSPEVLTFIRECHERFPALGRERIAALLQDNFAIDISPSTVARVLRAADEMRQTSEITNNTVPTTTPIETCAPHVSTVPVVAPNDVSDKPHCLFCAARGWNFKRLKTALLFASVVANVALVGSMLAMALLEGSNVTADLAHSDTNKPQVISTVIYP